MRHVMRKLSGLNGRSYTTNLIDLNKYLDSLPGDELSGKVGITELNKILLNSMPNSWSKQAYVQGFECGYISFKNQLTCLNTWIFLNQFINM